MTSEDIQDIVIRTVAEQFMVDVDEVTMDTNFYNDLHADSLDYVELIMELEEDFGMDIGDEEGENVETVRDIVELLEHVLL